MAPPPATVPPRPPDRPRRRAPWATSLALVLIPLALLVAAVLGGGWWLYTTPSGLRAALSLAGTFTGLRMEATGVDGSLRDGFQAQQLRIAASGWSVDAHGLLVEPRALDFTRRRVHLQRLQANTVDVRWQAGPDTGEPPRPPDSLASPVDLVIDRARIGTLRLQPPDSEVIEVRDITLAGRADANEIVIDSLSATHGPSQGSLQARIGAQPPFNLTARGHLKSTLQQQGVGAQLAAEGTLSDLRVEFSADADAARAQGIAELRPFAPVPVTRLQANLRDIDPGVWVEGLPQMRLSGEVDLRPLTDAAGLAVSGPFSVRNALPGAVDRQRLPVRTAEGSLLWRDDRLTLQLDRVETVSGRASGRVAWTQAEGIDATIAFQNIDAAAIHTAMQATRASGEVRYTQRGATHRFVGQASNATAPQIDARFDLTLHDNVLDIATADVQLGQGRAQLRGRVGLTGPQPVQLSGTVSAFDLGELVRGVDTRLTGTVAVDGRLQPSPRGTAKLELTDSRLAGRPVQGRVALQLQDDIVTADVDISSGSATLRAEGGLGGGRTIDFALQAPNLSELLPELAGAVNARGTISGTLQQPAVDGRLQASELRYAGHRVAALEGSVRGGLAAQAPLDVDLQITQYTSPAGPELSLTQAALQARGTTRQHTLSFSARTATEQPLQLQARGGWIDSAWRGELVSASTGAPLNLRVTEPVRVHWSPSLTDIGPARFELRAVRFDEVQARLENGRWMTQGTFAGFRPQDLDPNVRRPRRVVVGDAVDRVPLTLAGRWQIAVDDSVTGIAVIERTGGDFYAGLGSLTPIGISDLGIAMSILNNRVTGNAYLRGTRLGSIDAVIDAWVEPLAGVGFRLAQQRPMRIDVDANLPDISWVSPLVGENVEIGGAGLARVRVSGTPQDPTANGTITGTGLRLASIELGVRLENGLLEAELEEGVLVVNRLAFAGVPRARPDERRAAADVGMETSGQLTGVGRIALRSLTGSFGLQAEDLPVLQRPDRWLVVSGRGGITLTPRRVDIVADLRADGAFINFDALRGPRQLPADVVVIRSPAEQRRVRQPTVAVHLQVNGDLGPRFYIRGAGLDARLEGQVRVVGQPGGLLMATGSVRTVDGQYAGYGQRLQIERGIITFQGALDNPALNVLAVRTGLPVEVGVNIGGTALQPVVRLHSSPAMPDIERLNWLVLGRPLGGETGQERALLTAAAGALFAGQTDGAGAGLLQQMGIDELSLRPGHGSASLMPRETVAGTLRTGTATTMNEVVAIGKRITDDLYLSFEQALSGAEYYVALNYQISQRVSLIARAGSTTALDLVWSFAFD